MAFRFQLSYFADATGIYDLLQVHPKIHMAEFHVASYPFSLDLAPKPGVMIKPGTEVHVFCRKQAPTDRPEDLVYCASLSPLETVVSIVPPFRMPPPSFGIQIIAVVLTGHALKRRIQAPNLRLPGTVELHEMYCVAFSNLLRQSGSAAGAPGGATPAFGDSGDRQDSHVGHKRADRPAAAPTTRLAAVGSAADGATAGGSMPTSPRCRGPSCHAVSASPTRRPHHQRDPSSDTAGVIAAS